MAGYLQENAGGNGKRVVFECVSVDFEIVASIATYEFADIVPAEAVIDYIETEVIVALTGPTGFKVGPTGGDDDLYGVAAAVTAGTRLKQSDRTAAITAPIATATDMLVTFNGGNATAGTLRMSAHYRRYLTS